MSTIPPAWISAFLPDSTYELKPIRPGSTAVVWHSTIQLQAWKVPPGRLLRGSDNWNGKALVHPRRAKIERSVGEVELTDALRATFPDRHVFWTATSGNPPELWRPWALTRDLRIGWFSTFDEEVRRGIPDLEGTVRGLPDVLLWKTGRADVRCVEYKGPSPTNPRRHDTISDRQVAWTESAISRGLLDRDRYLVVTWTPSDEDVVLLKEQAASSKVARETRGR